MRASRRALPDAPPREPLCYVHTDEQWEAISSARRIEILQHLLALGPCSIADLAWSLDAPPDGLYHHVRTLTRAGLVREAGDRHTGRRRERLYDAAALRLRLDVDVGEGRNIGRLRAFAEAHLDRGRDALAQALRAKTIRLEEPLADTLIESAAARLDDESFAKVRRHLQSAIQILASARRSGSGRLYALTLLMCPLSRTRGADTRPTNRLARRRAATAPRAE